MSLIYEPYRNKKPNTAFFSEGNGPISIIVAIIAALGGIGAAIINKVNKKDPISEERDEEKKIIHGLKKIQDFNLKLQNFQEHGAERVILFRGHNGGGYPAPGMPYYVSASRCWTSLGSEQQILNNYRNLLVDAEYITMLLDAWSDRKKAVVLITEQMPDCELKSYYLAEGVSTSMVIILGMRERSLFYMSAAKYGGLFEEAEKTLIRLSANALWQDINI